MTSKERQQPADPFGFTEQEKLWDRMGEERFRALIEDEATTIHKVELAANNYGEFTFVTLSREAEGQRSLMTFWGLGLHEYRERWIADHWHWYRANAFPETLKQRIALEEAQELLEQRRAEIAPYLGDETQSSRGRLFELIAEMSDDDGAWAELEDLGEVADWLLADEDEGNGIADL
jgi:hypothetical protein